jgi:hypothetical protein
LGKPAKKRAVKRAARRRPRDLFTVAHEAAKVIAASRIYELWVDVLGRPIKKLDDDPNDYGITSVIGYADFLNKKEQFKPYHLDLQQSDMVNVHNMGELGGAIVRNFQENGWVVTPN